MLIINKIDVMRPEDLGPDDKALIDEIIVKDSVPMLQLSCFTDEGVMSVRNTACDTLLADRVGQKIKAGGRMAGVINKLHLTTPVVRDEKARPAFIPESVKTRVKYDAKDPNRRVLERDLESEAGGAGVYSFDMKSIFASVINV